MDHDERTVSAVGEIAHNFVPSFAWLSRGCDVELNLAFNNFEGERPCGPFPKGGLKTPVWR